MIRNPSPLRFMFVMMGLAGCATHRSVGEEYHAACKHNLSVHYYAQSYFQDRQSERATKEIVKSVYTSMINLDKEFDDAMAKQDPISALKVAVRQEELLTWAYRQKISTFNPNTVRIRVETTWESAVQQAQKEIDKAADISLEQEMIALRQAIALDPDNEEFNARYDRLRNFRQRQIVARTDCPYEIQDRCDQALSDLISHLTFANREGLLITQEGSNTEDAELVLSMRLSESTSRWFVRRSGTTKKEIPIYNEFKEKMMDKKGNARKKEINVSWKIFNSTSASDVKVAVQIKSLRSDKEVLFTKELTKNASEIAGFYTWSGDHRALPASVTAIGTNQTPPTPPQVLTLKIRKEMMSSLSESILKKNGVIMRAIIPLFILLCACGPKYYYSGGAQPDWLNQVAGSGDMNRLQVVGMSPLTSNVQHDTELAVRNGKAQVAAMFVSEVDSQVTLWTMTSEKNGKVDNKEIFQNNIQIRSNVKVGDVKILESHRDKKTKSQYVLLTVDKNQWRSGLQKQIDAQLKMLVEAIEKSKASHAKKAALETLQNLQKGYQIGGAMEPDIIVMDLLAPENNVAETIRIQKTEMDTLKESILATHPFQIKVKISDEKLESEVQQRVRNFLSDLGHGFQFTEPTTAAEGIQVSISIGQEFIKTESVGSRVEYVYAATGKITVTEPNGSVLDDMTVSLRPKAYTVRAQNEAEGEKKALELAVETIGSKFRSKFRQMFLAD